VRQAKGQWRVETHLKEDTAVALPALNTAVDEQPFSVAEAEANERSFSAAAMPPPNTPNSATQGGAGSLRLTQLLTSNDLSLICRKIH
jgi:hypothetical protein